MKQLFTLALLSLLTQNIMAQNVGIGTTTPNSSAILDIQSTDKGILIPRTDTSTVNAHGNKASALLIYQNADSSFYYFDGARWRSIISRAGAIEAGNINSMIYSIPGTYFFTVPTGITKLIVEAWGAGGQGGWGNGQGCGGGGGYGKEIIPVTPGAVYQLTVGKGGSGWIIDGGVDGESSSFGSFYATGGFGGRLNTHDVNMGKGGYSNSSYIKIAGTDGNQTLGGNGANGGGPGGNANSPDGQEPGGGGIGVTYLTPSIIGKGAAGKVIVWW